MTDPAGSGSAVAADDRVPAAPVPSERERRHWRRDRGAFLIAGAAAAAAAAIGARYVLFAEGIFYGTGAARAASLVVGSVLLIASAAAVHGWRLMAEAREDAEPSPRTQPAVQDRAHPLAAAAVVLSVVVGATAAADAFAQNALSEAQAPPCPGASVAGSDFLAVTTETRIGVNVRSGPGTDGPQTGRFTSGCTLGFDGYCAGEPAPDFLTGEPDVRWLRLHRSDGYVSASVMRSVTSDRKVEPATTKSCKADGAGPPAGAAASDPPRGRAGEVTLSASSPGAVLLGFAILLPEARRQGTPSVRQVALVAADTNGRGRAGWMSAASTADLDGPGDIVAAVSVCLAGAVPQPGTQKPVRFSWDGRALRGPLAVNAPPDSRTLSRLETAACRSAYTFGPPETPAPAAP